MLDQDAAFKPLDPRIVAIKQPDEGKPDESGQVHRQKRPPLQIIKDIPLDWLLERNHIPALVMGIVMTCATGFGVALGASLGTFLAVNWTISQAPVVAQFIRMAYKNKQNHIYNPLKWDWSWWTRPQSHQKVDVAIGPEVALELQIDGLSFVNPKPTWIAKHVPGVQKIPFIGPHMVRRHPWLAQHIFFWECKLIVAADSPDRTFKRFWARQLDDLLNQRARTPSFVIGTTQLIVGRIFGLSTALNFVVNAIVSWIPIGLSMFIAWQTGDKYRFTRPGMRQRPTEVARRILAANDELTGVIIDHRRLATPSVPEGPHTQSPENVQENMVIPRNKPSSFLRRTPTVPVRHILRKAHQHAEIVGHPTQRTVREAHPTQRQASIDRELAD